jgi:uncharacterized protein YnzC (UPF0291/DUF896 family)
MMFKLECLREATRNMLEQLDRGKWVDELGHDVRLNTTVIKLRELLDAK